MVRGSNAVVYPQNTKLSRHWKYLHVMMREYRKQKILCSEKQWSPTYRWGDSIQILYPRSRFTGNRKRPKSLQTLERYKPATRRWFACYTNVIVYIDDHWSLDLWWNTLIHNYYIEIGFCVRWCSQVWTVHCNPDNECGAVVTWLLALYSVSGFRDRRDVGINIIILSYWFTDGRLRVVGSHHSQSLKHLTETFQNVSEWLRKSLKLVRN